MYQTLDEPVKLLIHADDHFSTNAHDHVIKVIYPWDQTTEVGQCYAMGLEQIPTVETAAQEGFENHRRTSVQERITILEKLADAIEQDRDTLAKLITMEAGKPIKLSSQEVDRAAGLFRAYAQSMSISKQKVYWIEGREGIVRHFPLGPVLAITPYNFPLNLVAHKLAPAIAAGCSITIKPASKTPLTALRLGRLAIRSGYTAINVVPCNSSVAGYLVKSNVFKKLSFTGSADVGWQLKSLAGKKVVTMELGGNAACIVHDIPLDRLSDVSNRIAQGAFWYAGQICISVQRILVHRPLYEDFLQAFTSATRILNVGDPMNAVTDVGPMISVEDVFRVRSLIKDAIDGGANVVYGGNTYNSFTMNPTIFNRTTPTMAINQEEVFAPIATVIPYDDFHEALAMVNDSCYGLQTGLYTQDPQQAKLAFETLDMGGVIINDIPSFRADYLPYGGVKDSGIGREGVLTGIAEMSYLKTMISRTL